MSTTNTSKSSFMVTEAKELGNIRPCIVIPSLVLVPENGSP